MLEINHLNFPAIWRTLTKIVKEGHDRFLDLSAIAAGKNSCQKYTFFMRINLRCKKENLFLNVYLFAAKRMMVSKIRTASAAPGPHFRA